MLLINGSTQINGALPESSEIPANAVPGVLGRQELLPWQHSSWTLTLLLFLPVEREIFPLAPVGEARLQQELGLLVGRWGLWCCCREGVM